MPRKAFLTDEERAERKRQRSYAKFLREQRVRQSEREAERKRKEEEKRQQNNSHSLYYALTIDKECFGPFKTVSAANLFRTQYDRYVSRNKQQELSILTQTQYDLHQVKSQWDKTINTTHANPFSKVDSNENKSR